MFILHNYNNLSKKFIFIFQTIYSQELQLSPKSGFDDSILIRKLLTQKNNNGYRCQTDNNLFARINLEYGPFFQGQNNLFPTNDYRWQKYGNTMPRSIGCGCQRQKSGVLPSPAIYNNMDTKCQKQNVLVPINSMGCRCQSQNALLSHNNSGWRKQQNAVMSLNNIGFDNRRKNTLLLPECKCKEQSLIRPNYIGCGCQRLAMPNRLKNIASSNLSVTDLPAILPNEVSNKIRIGKELANGRKSLSDLKTRLAEMADIVSATANLISKLPTSYDVNKLPISVNNNENENIKSNGDLPVTSS